MTKPHPSMTLLLDLDERLMSTSLRREIDRCYSYLGTPVVRTHPAAAGDPENTMQLKIRVGAREYLDSKAEGADELWNNYIEHWLLNQVHAVDNQMRIYNRRQREEGTDELIFTWIDFELQGGRLHVRMRLDSQCGIDPAESAWVTRVRSALNEGLLGEGVTCVQLPSDAYYAQQYEEGMQALAERKQAEALAAQEAERAAQEAAEQAEAEAEERFMASPAKLAEQAEAEFAAEEADDLVVAARIQQDLEAAKRGETDKTAEEIVAERIAEEAHLGEDIQRKYTLPEADFALRFDRWTVFYATGESRSFDAETGVLA